MTATEMSRCFLSCGYPPVNFLSQHRLTSSIVSLPVLFAILVIQLKNRFNAKAGEINIDVVINVTMLKRAITRSEVCIKYIKTSNPVKYIGNV